MAIGVEHPLQTRKRADQRQERRAWQVEVRDHRVDRLEPIARRNEKIRLALLCLERVSDRLQYPRGGRPHRDDPPAGGAGIVDNLGIGGIDAISLVMDLVVLHVLDADRFEGSRPNV